MINEILAQLQGHQVHFACKTGAELFCSNCSDKDVIVVVDGFDKPRFATDEADVFVYSLDEFEKLSQLSLGDMRDVYSLLIPLAQNGNVLCGINPLQNYDWFAHKQKIVETLLTYGERNVFNRRIKRKDAPENCLKISTWWFASYFALINHSVDFTPEQKNILQNCHDGLLPRDEAFAIRDKLIELLEV